MYEIYLAIGIILLVAGITTIILQIWFLKNRSKYDPSAVLFLSNTIATILVGGAYIYFTNILMNEKMDPTSTYTEITRIPETIEIVEVDDLLEFDNSTNRFIDKILNSTFRSPKSAMKRGGLFYTKKLQLCMPYNIFLQYIMVTYSFIQALVVHLSTTRNCRNCVVNKKSSLRTTESSTEGINSNLTKSQQCKTLLAHLIIVLLIPPLCASLLYFMTNYEEINNTIENQMTQYLYNPINTSTAINESQTNMIVENVYRIVADLKTSNSTISSTTNSNLDLFKLKPGCYNINTSFKVNLFLIFIVSYFATILYSVVTYLEAKPNISSAKSRNLKIMSYGFSSSWLSCIAEILIRIFLSEDLPDLIGQILKGLGNCNHLLINISNFLMHKKMLNNETHIKPIE